METLLSIVLIILLGFTSNVICDDDITFGKCSIKCEEEERMEKCPQTAYVFPRRSKTDYIRVKAAMAPLDEFSVCTRLKMYGTGVFVGTILSYAVPGSPNQFLIMFYDNGGTSSLDVEVLGETRYPTPHPLTTGGEHSVCFVFGRKAGFVNIYYDGNYDRKLSFTNRDPIPSGGAFMIGQDQDSYMGDFDANQAIHGEIVNYRIWDTMLTASEILRMHQSTCDCPRGYAMASRLDEIQLEGGVNALYQENKCN